MLIERYQNLSPAEKAESLQRGGFTRDGVEFRFWRSSGAGGEPWFRADEPASLVEFPEIHGTSAAAVDDEEEDRFRLPDDWAQDEDAFDVQRRIEAASTDEERIAIYNAWLLGDVL